MVFTAWFLVKFEDIFGQLKHHQIAWFLSQLQAYIVYYKV